MLSCMSRNYQECEVKPQIVNINSEESVFFHCNNINDPYAKMYVLDAVKNLNVKVFNLTSRTNEARHIEWHETCKCKRRLNSSVCNNKQRWNDGKCRCECEELIDKDVCDKGFIWNPSNEWNLSVNVINPATLESI